MSFFSFTPGVSWPLGSLPPTRDEDTHGQPVTRPGILIHGGEATLARVSCPPPPQIVFKIPFDFYENNFSDK